MYTCITGYVQSVMYVHGVIRCMLMVTMVTADCRCRLHISFNRYVYDQECGLCTLAMTNAIPRINPPGNRMEWRWCWGGGGKEEMAMCYLVLSN